MSGLRRFWFKFERLATPTPINLGCGVTAYSREDALTLLKERVFGVDDLPPVAEVIDDVEATALERKHVLPNLGNPLERGVWFPQGYETPLKDSNRR